MYPVVDLGEDPASVAIEAGIIKIDLKFPRSGFYFLPMDVRMAGAY
jgi:hypothetical protein